MADDIQISQGSGTVVATDEVSSRHYQIIKIAVGADGSATFLDGNSGNKSAGTLRVVLATDQPAMTNAQPVSLQPTTSGGSSIYKNLDIDETGVNVKASAGQLYGWYLFNNAASTRYVKLYDKATAPTVGTDAPVFTLPVPAGAAANVAFPNGIAFSNGIGVGAVTGVADSSTGAPSANDVTIALFYK